MREKGPPRGGWQSFAGTPCSKQTGEWEKTANSANRAELFALPFPSLNPGFELQ